jgi:hypothetical protein
VILDNVYDSYIWSTNETTASIVVGTEGVICVTVTDAEECTGSACIDIEEITVEPVILGEPEFCRRQTAYFVAEPGYASYSWSIGTTTQSLFVEIEGTYCVTVTDLYGCTGSVCVDVLELPAPEFAITGVFHVCQGGSTPLVAISSQNLNYYWSDGQVLVDQIEVSAPGTYCVTATDSSGCSSDLCVTVQEFELPVVWVQSPEYLCPGETLVLTCPEVTLPQVTCLINGEPFDDTISLGPGTYEFVLQTIDGCQTTSGLFTVGSGSTSLVTGDTTLCHGELLLVGGQVIRESVVDSIIWLGENSFGCDSVLVLTATFIEIVVEDTVTGNPIKGNAAISLTSVSGSKAPYTFQWNTGSRSSMISGLYSGFYSVTITDSVGCEKIRRYKLPSGSVGSTSNDEHVIIYPNPIQSEVVINTAFTSGTKWSLEVIDVFCRPVMRGDYTDSRIQIEFPYPRGLYYFIVTDDEAGYTNVNKIVCSGSD